MRPHKPVALLCASAAVAIGATVLLPSAAFAHGFVGDDSGNPTHTLTARAALKANGDMGGAQWEPQSLEAPKGFPASGPADGHLASAGNEQWSALDEQREDRWQKNVVEQGDVTVNWTFTAPHMTSQWRYFMTKEGWDPNDALDRDDLELIETVSHDGSAASNNPSHEITIPSDREGYHVIYAVWDVADTANAFYNVIDVDVQPSDGETPEPGEDTPRPPAWCRTPPSARSAPPRPRSPGVPGPTTAVSPATRSSSSGPRRTSSASSRNTPRPHDRPG